MEAEGYDVYEFEWWHFDYKDWRQYPILNLTVRGIGYCQTRRRENLLSF